MMQPIPDYNIHLVGVLLIDIVHSKAVLSFTPSSKQDEYYCQQQLSHKQSPSKFGIIWYDVLQRLTKKAVNTTFAPLIWIHFSIFTARNTARLLPSQNAAMPRRA